MYYLSVSPVVPITSFIAIKSPLFFNAYLPQIESKMIRQATLKLFQIVK